MRTKTLKNGYEINENYYLCYMFIIEKIMKMTPKEPQTQEEATRGAIAFMAMNDLWKLTENEDHQFTEQTRNLLMKEGLVHESTGQRATFANEDVKQIVSQFMKWEGVNPIFTNPLKEDSDHETSEVRCAATT